MCAICKSPTPNTKGRWNVDHDHVTGAVRGILCGQCNGGLGFFRDSTEALKSAISYLIKHGDDLGRLPTDWMVFA